MTNGMGHGEESPRRISFVQVVRLWRRLRKQGAASPNYDQAFERVAARVGGFVDWTSQQNRLETEFSMALQQLPDRAAQEKWVHDVAQIEPWLVSMALLGGARRPLSSDPMQARLFAELAIEAAAQMAPSTYPPALKAGLLVQANLLLAQALKGMDQNKEAEKALERAASILSEATPFEQRSRFLRLLRHLRKMQDIFDRMNQLFEKMADSLEERLADFDS